MKVYGTIALVLAGLMSLSAGQYRLAEIAGGGNPNDGKCRIEVIIDGVAEIHIRGNIATLLDISGQPSQWRHFQCNGVMPDNPINFQFLRIDGRGRQYLIQSPRNGEAAVVHIEDADPGSSVYTFDLMWNYLPVNGRRASNQNARVSPGSVQHLAPSTAASAR